METAIKWPNTPKHQNAKNTPENATKHSTARACGIMVHAHLTIQLASKIRLKLLVVNSVKLHLTALIYYITINFIYLCFNAFKVKGTILKVLENLVRTGVEKRYFLSSCEDFEEDMCTVVPGKILHNFFFNFSKSLHSTPNNTQFIFK